eukprot:CAMPEP_0174288258 /NCGR_PEP_ID=MMETSP0809-20121228/19798_1 /TAXON_ID=73025 ORGANISM="Eutreptiella gymnastica-like, Strain CCMP1594" /NCGR_SAMPLE_ID=MMETSP0809 /ASSEMBLY_ACC=CAM_ASM_000658 /LENGTH=84 /DNA_ID=CAMNT_0015385319 /DNA_START=92 /DNA_END=342 /DNA_ORIENTATION=+
MTDGDMSARGEGRRLAERESQQGRGRCGPQILTTHCRRLVDYLLSGAAIPSSALPPTPMGPGQPVVDCEPAASGGNMSSPPKES